MQKPAFNLTERAQEIVAAGKSPTVSVLLDGATGKPEDMVLRQMWVMQDSAGNPLIQCVVTDRELRDWTVDIRHICRVRPA